MKNEYKPEKIITDEVFGDLDQTIEIYIDTSFVILPLFYNWITKACNHIDARNWAFWLTKKKIYPINIRKCSLGNSFILTNIFCPILFVSEWHRTVHSIVNIFCHNFKFACIKALIICLGILSAVIIETSLKDFI